MGKTLSRITRLAILSLGLMLCAAFLWLLVRFFAYGDNHPINVALGVFGLAPVMQNVADMTWFSGLLKMYISCASAVAIYFSLACLAVAIAADVSDAFSASDQGKKCG